MYISNQSDQDVYFDNLAFAIAQGNIIEENHYYSYGLKIVAISSRKLADSYEGEIKNNYLYQGSFAELDEDIGWTDFPLRSYDAQTGRFTTHDPFDQFASGYVGMGNNPISFADPSGGFSIDFGTIGQITGSALADRALITLGGATLGFGINKLAGGNGWTGAAIGGAVGLAGTFIPPFDIGNIGSALGNAGQWVSDAVKSLGTSTSVTNTAAGSVIRFKSWFKVLGEVTVKTFNATATGLQIELLYKNVNSKLTNFNWIQAIRTNVPLGGAISPYNDPQPPDDSKPFYWTDPELPIYNVAPGYDARFSDAPSRGVNSAKTTTWKAELSVVGKNAAGEYKSIGTLKYGFKIKPNGTVSINGVNKRWTSSFQKGIIKTAR